MLSTYIFSGTLIKILGFGFIFLSDYYLSDELFVEQQSVFRYLIGISALITIGSDVSYRRYLHSQSFHMSFLLPFGVILTCMTGLLLYLPNHFDFLDVSVVLLFAAIMLKVNDFLKAELEFLRDKTKIIIFDVLAGPLVRYLVLILYLLTHKTFEVLLFICYFLVFVIGVVLLSRRHKLNYSFERKLSNKILKLTISYIPNRIQVFILEFLAVGAVVASYSPETSRLYFISLSYCAILQTISQSANRWYIRDRVDFGNSVFQQFTIFRILGILTIFSLYIIFLPFYLKLFSFDIFDREVFFVAIFLILNTLINLFQKFIVVELLVIERIWIPNILISLTMMIAPFVLINFDVEILIYLQILVFSSAVSVFIAAVILRISKNHQILQNKH
jgi:hypothetical protein